LRLSRMIACVRVRSRGDALGSWQLHAGETASSHRRPLMAATVRSPAAFQHDTPRTEARVVRCSFRRKAKPLHLKSASVLVHPATSCREYQVGRRSPARGFGGDQRIPARRLRIGTEPPAGVTGRGHQFVQRIRRRSVSMRTTRPCRPRSAPPTCRVVVAAILAADHTAADEGRTAPISTITMMI
jgi:hypothetical protein